VTPLFDRALRIAVGVNGIGMGHASRQAALAEHLRRCGHEVQFIATGGATQHLRGLGFTVHESWMPTLIASRGRVRWWPAITANIGNLHDGLRRYHAIARALRRTGVPDVFITDYEPAASYLAYQFDRPLLSIDQQSKFRFLNLPDIGAYTPTADRQRLSWFTPRATRAFICSFVPLAAPNASIEIIPPLLADDVWRSTPTSEPVITAYFSRYFGHGPHASARALARIVADNLPEISLRIYAHDADARQLVDLNSADDRIVVRRFDRASFLADLARSRCLVANAGFNLIAEAALLGKPQLLIPLPTYDQHWCARTVHDQHLGVASPDVTLNSLLALLDRTDEISSRAQRLRDEFLAKDARPLIAQHIERLAARKTNPDRVSTR
jgi:uncharacterized protein (TIGR00661 family)